MVSSLSGCGEGCGFIAAVLAAVCWGTFGVPIKTNVNVDVNFFVMQSYKTLVCFLTCWFVILLGEEVRFTPWGIVSGLFWVPGAACGIYGIRNAGLAIAVGTWSSIIVVSSFVFGILIFQEQVRDITQTIFAFGFLMCGLVGMSRYADPQQQQQQQQHQEYLGVSQSPDLLPLSNMDKSKTTNKTTAMTRTKATTIITSSPQTAPAILTSPPQKRKKGSKGITASPSPSLMSNDKMSPSVAPAKAFAGLVPMELETPTNISSSLDSNADPMIPLLSDDNYDNNLNNNTSSSSILDDGLYGDNYRCKIYNGRFFLFGGRVALTRRQLGICGAIVNGAWGGLNLIPLHYAQRDQGLSGAAYLISYACGSMLVCVIIWLLLFAYQYHQRGTIQDAWDALPSFHVRELALPGFLAGLLYSVGNFCSILAVAYLGQGVGYSLTQAQLLVSGLWGVFYFQEIRGRETICKWFMSAMTAIIGIVWLSYQHQGESVHR